MDASEQRPVYTVYYVSGDKKFNLTPALISLGRSDSEKQIAQRITMKLMNVLVDGNWLSGMITPEGRVIVYANDGTKNEEVFRGFPWTRKYVSSLNDHELSITCYDNLIYLQESEDYFFMSGGRTTDRLLTTICNKWGITLEYNFEKSLHSKLALRGNLYDIITTDILDPVKVRTGRKYVVFSDKDIMYVNYLGSNTDVYHFQVGKNITMTTSGWTMDGVVTKVVILGKADDDNRSPVEATVNGETSKYGTLQKIYNRDEDTCLDRAKREGQDIIAENGAPQMEYEITAPDIPWIRKGDKVYVNAGDIVKRYLYVTAVDRTCTLKKCEMTLTLKR